MCSDILISLGAALGAALLVRMIKALGSFGVIDQVREPLQLPCIAQDRDDPLKQYPASLSSTAAPKRHNRVPQ
jgi:hypothetical protein